MDLVEKLRDPEFPPPPAGTMALRLSAADEIERLRDELLTVQQAYVICRGILNDVDPTRERRKALSSE